MSLVGVVCRMWTGLSSDEHSTHVYSRAAVGYMRMRVMCTGVGAPVAVSYKWVSSDLDANVSSSRTQLKLGAAYDDVSDLH